MPVCIGSCTGLRAMMPGALISTWRLVRADDRALPSIGTTERVDDAAEQLLADRHLDDAAGALDGVAFADRLELAEERDADVVLLEVEHHADDRLAAGASNSTSSPAMRAGQAVDARDAVADGEHGAGLGDRDLLVVVLDLLADDVAESLRRGCPWSSSSLLGELVAEGAELGAEGTVVDRVADLGDDAAEQARDPRAW